MVFRSTCRSYELPTKQYNDLQTTFYRTTALDRQDCLNPSNWKILSLHLYVSLFNIFQHRPRHIITLSLYQGLPANCTRIRQLKAKWHFWVSKARTSISWCKLQVGWPLRSRCPTKWCPPGSSDHLSPGPAGDPRNLPDTNLGLQFRGQHTRISRGWTRVVLLAKTCFCSGRCSLSGLEPIKKNRHDKMLVWIQKIYTISFKKKYKYINPPDILIQQCATLFCKEL